MSDPITLPQLKWVPTQAKSSRRGARVRLVVVHRWGLRPPYTPQATASAYKGVINEFKNPDNEASSHIVYPGSAVKHGNEATQMVAWGDKAWTQAAFNPVSDSIEAADAIWTGSPAKVLDEHGFAVLARMVAKRLKDRGLPCVWVHGAALTHGQGGFCRHYDLGEMGGGHSDPTTDDKLWHRFVGAVHFEYHRGAFKPEWGR